MRVRIIAMLVLGTVLVLTITIGRQRAASFPVEATGQPRTPVLVELFTSEGCSSCPPADALLARLETSQPVAEAEIIALKQHVDYWNRLGWTDRFSSAAFSQRQSDYAETLRNSSVYTPQMIVDGQTEFVGSHESTARAAITRASRSPKARVQLRRTPKTAPEARASIPLHIEITDVPTITPGDTAEVLLAVTETRLSSRVTSGENSGRKLDHTAVVRDLRVVARLEPQGEFATDLIVPVSSDWKRENLRAVVFVQEQHSRRVLGAAQVRLAGD